ncbi:hypothetical protein [Vibrio splendidus]|uniref:hypothetical protein n=1 Tax=Vibrio splendidus TaxID=29497 RepID=UPI0024694E82|nr:hypothetical protein [Vibrio splendidus]MDH5915065.1 hypothetical protein [Vibrio splendidus]
MAGGYIGNCNKVTINGGKMSDFETALEVESCGEVSINEMEFVDTETSIKVSEVDTLKAKGNKETKPKSD